MNICSWQAFLCSWQPLDVGASKYIFTVFLRKNINSPLKWGKPYSKFHLGRYIVGYTFGNHVLWIRLHVAVKLNFRPYIRRYTSPNENFEYSYPLNIIIILNQNTFISLSSLTWQHEVKYMVHYLLRRECLTV